MPESFPPRLTELMKRYFSNWEIIELLGEGSYAKVYKIRRSGADEMSALKWISYTGDQVEQDMRERGVSEQELQDDRKLIKENLEKEIKVLKKLSSCDNIVMLYEYYTDVMKPDNSFDILMRMELLTPIKTIAKQLTVKQVIQLGKDICIALDICQQEKILHLDIKPENIFQDEKGHYKLGDFGSAMFSDRNSKSVHRRGTPLYMSPEMSQEQSCIDSRADLYALGLVMYELLNAQLPPLVEPNGKAVSVEMEQEAIKKRMAGAELPMPRQGKADLGRVVLKACAFDVNKRFDNAETMLEALNDLNDAAQEYEEQLEAYQPSKDSDSKQKVQQEKPDETKKALPRDTQRIYHTEKAIKPSDEPSTNDAPALPNPPPPHIAEKPNPFHIMREKRKKRRHVVFMVAAGVLIAGLAALIVILKMNDYNAYQDIHIEQQKQAYVLTWKNGGSGPWDVKVIRNGNIVIQESEKKERRTELLLTPGYEYQIDINGETRCSYLVSEWPAYHGDELVIQRMDCYSYNAKKDVQLQDYNYTNKEKYVLASLKIGQEGQKGYMLKGAALLPEGISKEIDVYLVADVGGMERITVSVLGEKLIEGKQIEPSYFRISLDEFIQRKAMQATSITCKLYADGELLPINKVIEVRSATKEE